METLGKLLIEGWEFEVADAQLYAYLLPTGKFCWSVKVSCVERIVGDEKIEPYVYSENLLGLRNKKIARWTDVIGQRLSWTEEYNEELDEHEAGFYVYTHRDIGNSTLEFLLKDQDLAIKWRGITGTDNEELENEDGESNFLLETVVKFVGYQTYRIPEEHALDELRKWVMAEELMPPKPGDNDALLFEPVNYM